MEVNRRAPAIAEANIEIKAALETVWRTQSDIDRWSDWNPDVQRSKLDGPLAPGSVFRWKSGGASIVSTLEEVEPMRRMAWTGIAMGARAVHTWEFEPHDGSVVVVTRESFEGWWVRLLPDLTRKMLDKTLSKWLQSLKQHSEAAQCDPAQ